MDIELSGAKDGMISSLSFDLPETANYILERKSVSYYPSNGNTFSPQGVRIVRFLLSSGSDWIDPSTLRLQMKFLNKGTAVLQPVSSCGACMFRRVRLLAGGVCIEDIDFYNLVYAMYDKLLPAEKRLNNASQAFGIPNEYYSNNFVGNPQNLNANFLSLNNSPPAIPVGGWKILTIPLLSGLLNCGKMLPLSYMNGLTIEIELVNNYTDACLATVAGAPIATISGSEVNSAPGADTAFSQLWEVQEAVIKVDQIVLDSAVQDEYTQYMMSGKTLPIPFTSFAHQVQVCNDSNPTISLSRSFSRLEAVFATFYKVPKIWGRTSASEATETAIVATHLPLRESNFFMHPQGSIYQYGNAPGTVNFQSSTAPFAEQSGYVHQYQTDPELQLQIGSKLIPEQPMRSSTEQYYHLLKTLNSTGFFDTYSCNITDKEYRYHSFIVAFDLKKLHGALASGLNTKMGDLITLKCRNLNLKSNNQAIVWNGVTIPQYVHFTLQYTGLLTI
jgi:hypothetical protein